jgi:putative transposase
MEKATPAATATPTTCLGGDWFDPLEEAVRGQVRAFIEQLLEEELQTALGRGGSERGLAAKGHRNGHRDRRLATTFGPLVLAVPRARLADDLGEREGKSELLPAYRRLSRRAELLIAQVYLAGVNTRRVRRALQTLFAGHVGKDASGRARRASTSTSAARSQAQLSGGLITSLSRRAKVEPSSMRSTVSPAGWPHSLRDADHRVAGADRAGT